MRKQSPRDRVVVVGIGEVKGNIHPEKDSMRLHSEAALCAIKDCGLEKEDIDGVITAGSILEGHLEHSAVFCQYMGINPAYTTVMQSGGASPCQMVIMGMEAIKSGLCNTLLITTGDSLSSKVTSDRLLRGMRNFYGIEDPGNFEFEHIYGTDFFVLNALVASRHMEVFGTTESQIARAALLAHNHGYMSGEGITKRLLKIDDVLNSDIVSYPLRALECTVPIDGGGAIVISSWERAKDLRKKPVFILGGGTSCNHRYITNMDDILVSGADESMKIALKNSRISRNEIDLIEIYDLTAMMFMVLLEDLGFCPKGESGRYIEGEDLTIGGRHPANTHGGCISRGHDGMSAIHHIIEAVRQLRGEASEKTKVKDAKVALVHATGGVFTTHATLILSSIF